VNEYRIAVLPGDGIGHEIMPPSVALMEQAARVSNSLALNFEHIDAGAAHYQRTGTAMRDEDMRRIESCDAVLLGAMGLPSIRYPDGREIAPQLDLRENFALFAGVRPVRTFPGVPSPLADARGQSLDFILIRESTEGLFAERGNAVRDGDQSVRDAMVITRPGSERLFNFAFELTRQRKADGHRGQLACVDKANVLESMHYFRSIFDEVGASYADIETTHLYVDATAMHFVRQPWLFDVLVTENMFGDILSDIGAALMGGLGMAPSADIGESQAVFQPCHGSAPDIAGQDKANPSAMILSASMLLTWLGDRAGDQGCKQAGKLLEQAVENAFASGSTMPMEFGGGDGTSAIAKAVEAELSKLVDAALSP
jgi:3-isopropylmalate dehydrogenase